MNKKKLEIYVHIPFCAKKCAYCDFLSFPGNMRMRREYTDKLLEEIRIQSSFVREYQVDTIFLGGGTPSVLDVTDITAIMGTLKEHYDIAPDAEITIEVNPGTVKMEGLVAYREAGINRVSMGLQSADDTELRYLGRIHTYDEFLKSFQRVRMAGFTNVNVDLISAIPGQTPESWRNTLKKTAMLKPEHISAYSLIVEEGTPFYDRYGGHVEMESYEMSQEERRRLMALPDLPDEDTEREMYYMTRNCLAEQGYERYEISNYARPGFECRHNVGYWTGTGYLGLGLGASSYLEGCRFHNTSDFQSYVSAHLDDEAEFCQALRQDMEQLSVKSKMEEFMFLGLRLTRGVSVEGFITRFGQSIRNVYGGVIDKLEREGLLEHKNGYYRLTERGLDLSNYAMSLFLLD
ncbi:oxygen-independent coproporphyrinogen III oxidase [Hungatella hathewayi]|uniref:Heme chaperone HemW n=2 Tax=Lachnospiraceae TaxID=186803 RepID=A0A3E4TT33_9FIRM|nr:oxygen-independent coproporphyrinogen III oxidase [Hungatella hathewayi]RGO74349.1 oxygen-independent coproporphyrinogen III oxidase [Hungatella hathewayi]RHM69480.1 oxygen-independent coproporphyrinogen III oxidase [Hungatella hathewayi]